MKIPVDDFKLYYYVNFIAEKLNSAFVVEKLARINQAKLVCTSIALSCFSSDR